MISFLEEPSLKFRHRQAVADPRLGLSLFGPYDGDMPSRPTSLPYVVIGTAAGIDMFRAFSATFSGPIIPEPEVDDRLGPCSQVFKRLSTVNGPLCL